MSIYVAKPVIVVSYNRMDERPGKPAGRDGGRDEGIEGTHGGVQWLSFVRSFLQHTINDGIFYFSEQNEAADPERRRISDQNLRSCDVFILLVSQFSVSSSRTIEELGIVRSRQGEGADVCFLPILLTPIPGEGLNKFLHKDLPHRKWTPLSSLSYRDRTEYMGDLTGEIAEIAAGILQRRTANLPRPNPATEFVYLNNRFDTARSRLWVRHREQASNYHARARELARALSGRLRKTDAIRDVSAALEALTNVLGESVDDVQPDQLRLAFRSINARAHAYALPGAGQEVPPEIVAELFELSLVLMDLQSFVRTGLEKHEKAIQELGLDPASAAQAKQALDFLLEGILTNNSMLSDRAKSALRTPSLVSDTAVDKVVKVQIEGDRTLIASNLALAVAQEMQKMGFGQITDRSATAGSSVPGEAVPLNTDREPDWNSFVKRMLARIEKSGPEALGDAATQAAASMLKAGLGTVGALAALFVLWPILNPMVIGSGATASIIAWIGFCLRQINNKSS